MQNDEHNKNSLKPETSKNMFEKAKQKVENHEAKKLQQSNKSRDINEIYKNGKTDEIEPNLFYERRKINIEDYRKDKTAYPHKFNISTQIPEFLKTYNELEKGVQIKGKKIKVAGRIYAKRVQGKMVFYDLGGLGEKVQIMASASNSELNLEEFVRLHHSCKRGDIVGVEGWPGKSKIGELSIFASDIIILSYCYHMLPKTRLENQEVRYRQRYLDCIVNPEIWKVFKTRNKIIKYVRDFLSDRQFLEVETPMMNTIPGGATARPFVTHHNDQNLQMFLRIAPELFLKMCIIGGMDRVFELGRNFRNESIDSTHNPEFTSIEFYQSYADYNDLMETTEELITGMVYSLFGCYKISYHAHGYHNPEIYIDFTPPWRRISMIDELNKSMGVNLPDDLETESAHHFLSQQCALRNIQCSFPQTTAKLLDKLITIFIEDKCINPTFIYDYPQLISPLAKGHRSKAGIAERFEVFVNKCELCNAYTELNDPVVQAENFRKQAINKNAGDPEAMSIDFNFVRSLEYGLAPCAGWGMGIDRLTMLLTDSTNIKDVLLFPAMKPE